ncbi:MAG: hypothetical protein H6707_09255 [Deltaproteobacteria bacterium]|nr:hypothetical protein [Deltaproteobacteria bacterium]
MFRLLKLAVGLTCLGALVYFAYTVPLGEKTLWEHIQAIAQTDETQQLVDGVKKTADKNLRAQAKASRPTEQHSDFTPAERAALRRLIRDKIASTAND